MDPKTILWPTDLSKTSLKAVPHVVSLAKKYDARVVLLYVGVDLCAYFPAYGNYPSKETLNHFREWELGEAKKKMEEICSADLKDCPNVAVRLVEGDAARQILNQVTLEKADLIVMTSRGHSLDNGAPTPGKVGSVAEKVVAGATVPVHMVNP